MSVLFRLLLLLSLLAPQLVGAQGQGTVVTKTLTNNSAIAVISATLASNTVIAGTIDYAIHVTNGTDLQIEDGVVNWHGINKGGVFSGMTITKRANQQDVSSGTLTVTWAITSANPTVITVNANSSLTPSAGYPKLAYSVHNKSLQSIGIQ